MLLATFQPIYNKQEMADGMHLRSVGRYPEAGFHNPVWCSPADRLEDLFVSALMAAPRFPDEFIMFETENFRRVDKLAWYQHVHEDRPFDASLLDPDLPDIECEFLVDYEDMKQHCVCSFSVVYLRAILASDKVPLVLREDNTSEMSSPVVTDCMNRIVDMLGYFDNTHVEFANGSGMQASNRAYKNEVHIMRWLFMFELMPYFWALASQQPEPELYAMAGHFKWNIMMPVRNRFCLWADDPDSICDAESFHKFVDEMRRGIVTDPGLLKYRQEHGAWPGLNEKCPCGSGKKFKKCCIGKCR